MNNKGFMMAEVIIVSAIVLTLLTTVYISFSKLYTLYLTRIDYYDVVSLYELAYYRDVLIEKEKMQDNLNRAKDGAIDITRASDDTYKVLLVNNKKSNDIKSKVSSLGISNKFSDYIDYLSQSDFLVNTNYVMVMERCINQDICKYTYLEVNDGKE